MLIYHLKLTNSILTSTYKTDFVISIVQNLRLLIQLIKLQIFFTKKKT